MARDCEGFSRRDFIKVGSAGLVGLTLPQLLKLESEARANPTPASRSSRRATSVIMVWLSGGPATIDMWDLRPNAPEGIRGEFREIPTAAAGIKICEHLPKMASVMDRCTVVRSLAHTIPSHGPATVFMTTGNRPTPALQYPAIGALKTRLMPAATGVPPYVSFTELRNGSAGQAGYLGTGYNPFIVEGDPQVRARPNSPTAANLRVRGIQLPTGFTLEQLENRDQPDAHFTDETFQAVDRNSDLVGGLDAFHRQALEILRSDKTRNAFALERESNAVRTRYGMTPFGQGALAARRLIEAGVRFTTVRIWAAGWGHARPNLSTLIAAVCCRSSTSTLVGPHRRPGQSRHVGKHDRLLCRRVRPHPAHQPQRRPRSLGPLDGRPARRRRFPSRLRPRHHRCLRHGPDHRRLHPRRRIVHHLPVPRPRPARRAANPDRPPGPALSAMKAAPSRGPDRVAQSGQAPG